MRTPVHVNDKRIMVAGASSGLGAFFAKRLAELGAEVIVTARREDRLRIVVDSINDAGGKARAIVMDVRDAQCVERAFEIAGPLDVLVFNTGVTLAKPVLQQSEADWDLVIDTNLKGAFLVTSAAARHMRAEKRTGSIVNIASILGLRQAGHVAGYATSKAGLIQLTKVMAAELARYGIRVNAIAPGYIDTELNSDFWSTVEGAALLKRIPQRRLGKPEDLIAPLLLLCSDASSYMTGSIIAVDGGHLCSTL